MKQTRRLQWGILSTARIGRSLFIPGVRASDETEVLAVGSRNADTARAFAAELGIPRSYGSYEELLADPDVDAVYICLPNSLHAEWTIKAARSGKHVLCEKPVSRYAADAERMASACREADVLLMEAFMWRHHPQHARVRALLDAGTIGEPRIARISFGFVIKAWESSTLNARLVPQLDGGCLSDVACYSINVARWIFGSEPVALVGQQSVDPEYGVDTTFGGVLRFPNGQLAMVDGSFYHDYTQRYEIAGADGRIVVERAFRPDSLPGRIDIYHGADHRVEEIPPVNQYAAEADHFARSIRAGRLLEPAEDGEAQARAIESLYTSAAQNT